MSYDLIFLAREQAKTNETYALRATIALLGDALKIGRLDFVMLEEIGDCLVELTRNDDWLVRRQVAVACFHFRHLSFDKVIAPLLKDANPHVASAAMNAQNRRRAQLNRDPFEEARDHVAGRLLASLDPKVQRVVRRINMDLMNMFVRQAYHEVTGPLASVDAGLGNLAKELGAAENIEGQALRRATERLNRARGNVVRIMKIQKSLHGYVWDTEQPQQVTTVRELVDQALGDVSQNPVVHNAPPTWIQVDVDPSLSIKGWAYRVVQALKNVINNAVESYHGLSRELAVRVRAKSDSGSVEVSVTDGGCGMSKRVLREAPQFFFSTKKDQGGTGLGLALVQRIVEGEHGGELRLESVRGKGTTVTLRFPVSDMDNE